MWDRRYAKTCRFHATSHSSIRTCWWRSDLFHLWRTLVNGKTFFNVHISVHRKSISIIVQQYGTMYSLLYFFTLLYMFRVVTPPIIRSTYNSNYNIWHWSNFGKCSVWSQLNMRVMDPSDQTSRSLTSARCCNYSYMCSWWWVELPPETCTAVYRNIINCTSRIFLDNYWH
jgi:hypothetical protein